MRQNINDLLSEADKLENYLNKISNSIRYIEEKLGKELKFNFEYTYTILDDFEGSSYLKWNSHPESKKRKKKFRIYLEAGTLKKAFQECKVETKIKYAPHLTAFVDGFTKHVQEMKDSIKNVAIEFEKEIKEL